MADSNDIVGDRRHLANQVITYSGAAILVLSVCIIVGTAFIYGIRADADFTADDAVGSLQTLLSTILPLLGAWVGAVIAFYFARENLDAAARNTNALLREVQPDKLQSIPASQVMIPLARLEVVKTTSGDGEALKEIIKRFNDKGLGRIIILTDAGTGRGVFQDGVVSRYLLSQAPEAQATATMGQMLADAAEASLLDSSAVYGLESTTLAALKADMEAKSKTTARSCRDAFITTDGTSAGKVVGYVSNIDIGAEGAFK